MNWNSQPPVKGSHRLTMDRFYLDVAQIHFELLTHERDLEIFIAVKEQITLNRPFFIQIILSSAELAHRAVKGCSTTQASDWYLIHIMSSAAHQCRQCRMCRTMQEQEPGRELSEAGSLSSSGCWSECRIHQRETYRPDG